MRCRASPPMSGPVTVRTVSRLQHDHRGTDRHAIIEVDYVLVDEPDAAARRVSAGAIEVQECGPDVAPSWRGILATDHGHRPFNYDILAHMGDAHFDFVTRLRPVAS